MPRGEHGGKQGAAVRAAAAPAVPAEGGVTVKTPSGEWGIGCTNQLQGAQPPHPSTRKAAARWCKALLGHPTVWPRHGLAIWKAHTGCSDASWSPPRPQTGARMGGARQHHPSLQFCRPVVQSTAVAPHSLAQHRWPDLGGAQWAQWRRNAAALRSGGSGHGWRPAPPPQPAILQISAWCPSQKSTFLLFLVSNSCGHYGFHAGTPLNKKLLSMFNNLQTAASAASTLLNALAAGSPNAAQRVGYINSLNLGEIKDWRNPETAAQHIAAAQVALRWADKTTG